MKGRELCAGGCGTDPDSWRDPVTKRILRNPPWKVTVDVCEGCRRIKDARDAVSSDEAAFTHVYLQAVDPDAFDIKDHAPEDD